MRPVTEWIDRMPAAAAINADQVRAHLLATLTDIYLGDTIAAQFTLYNMLSKVYAWCALTDHLYCRSVKRHNARAIGSFCVNIYGVNAATHAHVVDKLNALFTFLLPLVRLCTLLGTLQITCSTTHYA
jgi:hypothetical protein